MNKNSEIITTQECLCAIRRHCDPRLLNLVFDEVDVIYSHYSNFWEITSFILNQNSAICIIDKVQVATIFVMLGVVVEFDGKVFKTTYAELWDHLLSHKYIMKQDYDWLIANFWLGGIITFSKESI